MRLFILRLLLNFNPRSTKHYITQRPKIISLELLSIMIIKIKTINLVPTRYSVVKRYRYMLANLKASKEGSTTFQTKNVSKKW